MKLYLENIGRLSNTEIIIDGITVIAGKNGTGKSTVGKSLYSMFYSFYDYKEKIDDLRKNMIISEIRRRTSSFFIRSINGDLINSFLINLYENRNEYREDDEKLKKHIIEFLNEVDSLKEYNIPSKSSSDDEVDQELIDAVLEILFMNDDKLLSYIIKQTFSYEFNNQIKNLANIDKNSVIDVQIKDTNLRVNINESNNFSVNNPILINKKIVYIDDPYIVDEISIYPYYDQSILDFNNHRDDLINLLNKDKSPSSLLIDESLSIIDDHLNKASKINILKSNDRYFYNSEDDDQGKIDIKNASTGLKTFIIIKMLLENGSLQKNGTIILDEPETHLHPDWQIIFAELIVLLNKYLGMHILINSHSPYFVRAIEVYSAKHEVADKCRYYLSYNNHDTGLSDIKEVSESIDEIYSKLAEAFDILEQDSVN
ncbi:ATP-binding protein [Anaerococcus sp. Marseille-Q7828]|uniref:ATP-binding protein n=1 Tax=Anaerococcus sp. Marseille-Q7828 TaxID=3036300 RepID=UPI0024AE0FFB|nr:ATP-binding protein [Anaerococcus sp. Marseille-Q7828]